MNVITPMPNDNSKMIANIFDESLDFEESFKKVIYNNFIN